MRSTAETVPTLVLVAADRESAGNPFLALLTSRGYVLQRLSAGGQTLRRARDGAPDLIVVDLALRDMGAFDLCRALRADPGAAIGTPVVVLSDTALTHSQRLAAFAAGAWECVAPGSDPEELLYRIESYVRAKRLVDTVRRHGLVDLDTGLYNREGLARRAREVGAEAYRQPGALACVVLSVYPDPDLPLERAQNAIARWARSIQADSRLSDVIGRLSQREFAVLAPATDAAGAAKLAERLATSMEQALRAEGVSDAGLRVRAGYDAVGNMKYAPVPPLDLVARAAAALRTGRREGQRGWVRRSDPNAGHAD